MAGWPNEKQKVTRGTRWEGKPRGARPRDECTPRGGRMWGAIPAEGVLDQHGRGDPGKAYRRGESHYQASLGTWASQHLVFISLIATKWLAREEKPSAEFVRPQGQKHHQHRSFLTSPQKSGHIPCAACCQLVVQAQAQPDSRGEQTPLLRREILKDQGGGYSRRRVSSSHCSPHFCVSSLISD